MRRGWPALLSYSAALAVQHDSRVWGVLITTMSLNKGLAIALQGCNVCSVAPIDCSSLLTVFGGLFLHARAPTRC